MPRVPSLDGLRGIAVLSVILFHCVVLTRTDGVRSIDRLFEDVVRFGQPVALDLFFVISGYLITSIIDRTRTSDNPLRTFYLRRLLRIMPLYYGFLIFVVVFLHNLPDRIVGKPGSMIWVFAFLTNFAIALHGSGAVGDVFRHLWTLAIEEQFYLIWPLLLLLQPANRNMRTCLIVLGLSAITRFVISFETNLHVFAIPQHAATGFEYAGFFLTPTRLDGLAAGAAIALLQARDPGKVLRISGNAMKWSAAGGLCAITLLVAGFNSSHREACYALYLSAMPLFSSVFFASAVGKLVVMPAELSPKWMASPVLTSVARYSYGMYMFHMPLITLLLYSGVIKQKASVGGYDFPYRTCLFATIAGISWALGFVSWHLYEKRFLELAPRYHNSKNRQGGVRLELYSPSATSAKKGVHAANTSGRRIRATLFPL